MNIKNRLYKRKFLLMTGVLCTILFLSCSSNTINGTITDNLKSDAFRIDEEQIERSFKRASNNNGPVVLKTVATGNGSRGRRWVAREGSNCSYEKVYEEEFTEEQKEEMIQEVGRSASGLWGSENAESLKYLPRDKMGYYPDWVAATDLGIINPLASLDGTNPEVPDQEDTLMIVKSPIRNNVCFPHSIHTYWLNCNNCHPEIFIPKKNANPISMTKIIKGEFCGRCHGKVAFHVANNCHRCHNTPKNNRY